MLTSAQSCGITDTGIVYGAIFYSHIVYESHMKPIPFSLQPACSRITHQVGCSSILRYILYSYTSK